MRFLEKRRECKLTGLLYADDLVFFGEFGGRPLSEGGELDFRKKEERGDCLASCMQITLFCVVSRRKT